jgi:transposase
MAKLREEHVMIAQEMVTRGSSIRQVAAQYGVDESTLRYRLRRPPAGPDGRRQRATALDGWSEVVHAVLMRFGDERVTPDGQARCATRVVYDVLVREYGFSGSYQAVRRHLRRAFGTPPVQAVRRVETPPGVQAQHDWFEWTGRLAGEMVPLYGLIGTLAHSRATFVWVSRTLNQLAWQSGHLALFRRYGGVPLWIRFDNLKTAVAAGAGPTAVLNRAFVAFARSCGFQVDPCRAGVASDKGQGRAPGADRAQRLRRPGAARLALARGPASGARCARGGAPRPPALPGHGYERGRGPGRRAAPAAAAARRA